MEMFFGEDGCLTEAVARVCRPDRTAAFIKTVDMLYYSTNE